MRAMPLLNALSRRLEAFKANRRANVAITFAIASIPIILSVGAAVDYSIASSVKARLDALADAAALYGVNKTNVTWTTAVAKTNVSNFFNAQATAVYGATVGTVGTSVTDKSSVRTVAVNYTAAVPTKFMGLVGYNTVNVKGTSTATSATPVYADFYLLLDNTPSMGVGATPADVTKMVNNTPDKCAFACHDLSTKPNDYYSLAKKLGVTTRIDVVRLAAQNLTDTASSAEVVSNQFRMAIYSFGAKAESAGLTKVAPLSGNLSTVKSNAAALDLMTVPYQNYKSDQLTDFDDVLADMNAEIATPGDGTSQTAPQKFLFFVSDGVADAYYPSTCSKPTSAGRCQEPLTVAGCTAMKNRGIKIAVLYTTYLALPTNAWYMTWIAPFNKGPYGPSPNSEIAKNMETCASPGFYFEVSPTQGISDAMNALFQKIVQYAHLTK